MLKLARLFGTLFSLSLRRQLAFRADLLFEIALATIAIASSLAALGMIYTRTSSLGGWTPGEAIALLGTFQIISALRAAFVEPNLQWFGRQVMDGRFDELLTQPAPAIFLPASPAARRWRFPRSSSAERSSATASTSPASPSRRSQSGCGYSSLSPPPRSCGRPGQ
jgi:ABC-type uncharacterized transport system permease subunit